MEKRDFQELLELSKNLKVLLVDDDLMLLENYKNMAEKFFKEVYTASDGGEALQMHDVGRFDIIYTDINMPTMNGVELIREIKKYDPNQQFIVISASDDSNYLLELLQLQVNSFIVKPFQLENFIRTTRDKVSIIIQNKLMQERALELEQKLEQVTQEKKAQEEMLIQQSKLAETGEMISMIAHQWRQPLSRISSIVATLKTRVDLDAYGSGAEAKDKIVEDLYDAFEKIEDSTSFLSNTINDFRNFYRPDNAPKSFDILHAIDTILNMTVAPSSNFTIKKDYKVQGDTKVVTFEGELQQVIVNIINNAKDIFEEKHVMNARIVIKVEKDEMQYTITITDNAGGIPDHIIEHIFLPYFSTKDKKNGTGIGLHMTKTIIESHMKGTIDVDNDMIMGGARFKIAIPITLGETLHV